ncbi:MAG: hypothetical protein Q9174_001634 [Haloplaca sp. 1 TL-2023]
MLGWRLLQRTIRIHHTLLEPNGNSLVIRGVSLLQRPFTSSSSRNDAKSREGNIAVLGGGITGLASAYYLARHLPRTNITLLEGSPRLGGWLRSTQVDVGTGKVVFEQGPRSVRPSRPNGWVTLDLVRDLGLEDQVLATSKESLAAQNRFIYFPDHLVRLPGPGTSMLNAIYSMLSEPIFRGLMWACVTEFSKPARAKVDKSHDDEDESIGSFMSRRVSPGFVDNIVSAGIHGIYAGDVYQLSIRTIFPWFWYAENLMGSASKALVERCSLQWKQDAALEAEWVKEPRVSDAMWAMRSSSVYTFKKGIGQLADQLVTKLRASSNVTIRTETVVEEIQPSQGRDTETVSPKFLITESLTHSVQMQILTRSVNEAPWQVQTESFDHLVSTISGKALSGIVKPGPSLAMLSQTPSVTVMVVNLYYSNPSVLPSRGFGYLLPRSLSFEQNPERALGVIFDSDATIGQDEIPGTKITVMLGGHWWDGWAAYPDEDHGASMAKAILKRHLSISEEPQAVRVGLQRDCIPQYTVGHHQRMEQANSALKKFGGRLRVAGNSYNGVGLNDCIRSARDVAVSLVEDSGERTGLESFDQKNRPAFTHAKDK